MSRKAWINRVGWALLVGGLALWIVPFVVILWKPDVPRLRLPLGDVTSFAVDTGGRVFCASMSYGRVQAYSREGRFLRGWSVEAGGGMFRLRTDRKGHVIAATARTNLLLTYDAAGRLLERAKVPNSVFDSFARRTSHTDGSGSRYEIRSSTLMPRVYREVRKGEWELVAADPWYLWPLAAPVPAFAWLLTGIALVCWARRRRQARREPAAG